MGGSGGARSSSPTRPTYLVRVRVRVWVWAWVWVWVSRLRRDQDVTDLRERDAVRRLAALAAAEAELLAVQREDLLRVRVRIRGKG